MERSREQAKSTSQPTDIDFSHSKAYCRKTSGDASVCFSSTLFYAVSGLCTPRTKQKRFCSTLLPFVCVLIKHCADGRACTKTHKGLKKTRCVSHQTTDDTRHIHKEILERRMCWCLCCLTLRESVFECKCPPSSSLVRHQGQLRCSRLLSGSNNGQYWRESPHTHTYAYTNPFIHQCQQRTHEAQVMICHHEAHMIKFTPVVHKRYH